MAGGSANIKNTPPGAISCADLVALADVVITKPGCGIVSECIPNATAVLYTCRGDFREQPQLVEGLRRFARCRQIDSESLDSGCRLAQLEALPKQPPPAAAIAREDDRVSAEPLARFSVERRHT